MKLMHLFVCLLSSSLVAFLCLLHELREMPCIA